MDQINLEGIGRAFKGPPIMEEIRQSNFSHPTMAGQIQVPHRW